jgi:hypothetical protein
MADDTRDVIDQIQSRSRDYTGKELSPQEMATEFAKWDMVARVNTLQDIGADTGELTVRQAAKRHAYESALRNTHELLRKVGR